jgi:hypothetical protein
VAARISVSFRFFCHILLAVQLIITLHSLRQVISRRHYPGNSVSQTRYASGNRVHSPLLVVEWKHNKCR